MTTTTDDITIPENLSALAEDVAARDAALQVAIETEHDAAAELLRRVLATVKPALRAIASRPVIRYRVWWPDSVSTADETTRATWAGRRVSGDGVEEDHPRANEGSYEGSSLYLRADGEFVRLSYSGSWSRWQGASSEWSADEATLSIEEVARRYKVADIVEGLTDALERYVKGHAMDRAKQARERADKLRAVAQLIGK